MNRVVEYVSRPGNLGLLFDQQQYELRVDQEGPAGETRQQQNENGALHNDADSQQIPTPERLKAVFSSSMCRFDMRGGKNHQ